MSVFDAIPLELLTAVLPTYVAPERRYHNWGHIRSMWKTAVGLKWKLSRAEQLAVLCHDLVYTPGAPAGENERLSAARMRELIAERHIDVPRLALIEAEEIILATAAPHATSMLAARVCDLDLAILASSPEEWKRYREAVREEFAHMPDDAFREGSEAFFKGLLAHPFIYNTPEAQKRFERRARVNIENELKRLGRPAG